MSGTRFGRVQESASLSTWLALGESGELAFAGSFFDGIPLRNAIWGPRASTSPELLAKSGDPVPGASPEVSFDSFFEGSPVLDATSRTFFQAQFIRSGSSYRETGYWVHDPVGGLRRLEGSGSRRGSISEAGHGAFSTRVGSTGPWGESELWFFDAGGAAERIVAADRTPPIYPFGSQLWNTNVLSVSEHGDVVFVAQVRSQDRDVLEDQAAFYYQHPFSGPPIRILRSGDEVQPAVGGPRNVDDVILIGRGITGGAERQPANQRGRVLLGPRFEDGSDGLVLIAIDHQADTDGDGVPDAADNCVFTPNMKQRDLDGDWVGDQCNWSMDPDRDGFRFELDNCPFDKNSDQADSDGDGVGDACNEADDADGDDIADSFDNCPDVPNVDQSERDGDGLGDACDPFPDEPDNEKGQLRVDLSTCESVLGACLDRRIFIDDAGDGEEDSGDSCLQTPAGEPVDKAGCSLTEFCTSVESVPFHKRPGACRRADWQDDEREVRRPRDCAIVIDWIGWPPRFSCISDGS